MYDEGLRFTCCRCSNCCRLEPGFVYVSRSDLTKLCRRFNLSEQAFISTYCRWAPYYGGDEVLCLKETTTYDCILWKDGCIAYDARPVQCVTYPFWTWLLQDTEAWETCAHGCPGMNTGRLWTRDEIERQERAYRENEPLRRHEVEKRG